VLNLPLYPLVTLAADCSLISAMTQARSSTSGLFPWQGLAPKSCVGAAAWAAGSLLGLEAWFLVTASPMVAPMKPRAATPKTPEISFHLPTFAGALSSDICSGTGSVFSEEVGHILIKKVDNRCRGWTCPQGIFPNCGR